MAYGAYVQSRSVNSGAGTSADLAYNSNNTAGNTLIVGVRHTGDPGTVGLTDTRGNLHLPVKAGNDGITWLSIYYVPSCTAGANTVTLTNTNAVIRRWIITEFEGASSIDTTGGPDADFGSILNCGDLATTATITLLIGLGSTGDDATFTEGPSYSIAEQIERVALQSRVVTSANTYSNGFFLGGDDGWVGIGAAFAPTVTGPLVTASPAQIGWAASPSPLTRTVVVTPARLQGQAQTLTIRSISLSAPARLQWHAQTTMRVTTVQVTPTKLQWAAQVVLHGVFLMAPAHIQWRAQIVLRVTTLRGAPSQLQWTTTGTHTYLPSTILGTGGIILTRGRRLATPRLRLPAVQGMNETHPLNEGLLAWYLAQPWMFPGTRWDELVNGYEGTLTSMAAGSPQSGFGSTTRPGGRGEVRFDGVDDRVVLAPLDIGSNMFTLALWMQPTRQNGVGEYGALLVESNNRGLFYNQDTLNYYEFSSHRASVSIQPYTWTHVAVVSDGESLTFYLNGLLAGTATYSVGALTVNQLGNDETDVAFQGALDDIRVSRGALTPRAIADLYTASLTGSLALLHYPQRLWMLGGLPAPRQIAPVHVQWQAQALRFDRHVALTPARLQWHTQGTTVALRLPPIGLVVHRGRSIVQPRLRVAPQAGLQHDAVQRLGLQAWYLAQPWQFAGEGWLDLVRGRQAEARDMPVGSGIAGWQAGTRPGGSGSMGFDGSTQTLVVPPDVSLRTLTHMTLSLWISPRSFGTTGKVRLLDTMGIAGLAGFALGLTTVEATSRAVEFNVGGVHTLTACSADNVIDLGMWTHLTVVWTGSFARADVAIYINGLQVPTSASAGSEGVGPPTDDSLQALYIGNRDALDRGYDGWLDDIRLYTTALAPVDVAAQYQESLTGNPHLLRRPWVPMFFGGEPPRRAVATPARLQWQVQTTTQTRSAAVSPGQMRWQTPSSTLSRRLEVTPAHLQWRVPLWQRGSLQLTPSRMQWQAVMPLSSARVVTVSPTQMQWRTMSTAPIAVDPGARLHTFLYLPVPTTWHHKPPMGTRLNQAHPLAQGLEACWLFHEGQGVRAYDLSGHNRHITFGLDSLQPTNSGWSTSHHPAIRGAALECFETSGSMPILPFVVSNIENPLVFAQLGHQDFTVEFWLNSRLPVNQVGCLFSNDLTANNGRITLFNNQGSIAIEWQDSFTTIARTPFMFASDTWLHLVVTRTGRDTNAATVRIYESGRELLVQDTLVTGALQWSRFGNDGGSATFIGLVGSGRVWRRALSQEDIQALYAQPWSMFTRMRTLAASLPPALQPARTRWAAQGVVRTLGILPAPAETRWAAASPVLSGTLNPATPATMRWQPQGLHRKIDVLPVTMRWKAHQQRLPVGLVIRDCGPDYEAAFQRTTIGGDWLIQAPAIGLRVSMNYEAGGGWEHRLVDISDIEISAPPGGGITSGSNVTISIAETGHGQSIVSLWEQAAAVEAVEVTIDFLGADQLSVLRLFTGNIDSITVKDAVAQLFLTDASVHHNLAIPQELATAETYPQADQAALTRPIPLVYGQGSKIGAAPLLFVDVTTNTYLVANHPMRLGGKLAVYDQPTQTFLTLDAVVFIPNNGNASITLGTINSGALQVAREENPVNNAAAIDGSSSTYAIVRTAIPGPGYASAIQIGDGWGYAGWGYGVPAYPLTTTIKVDITNHRRAPGSDPTTTGQFYLRGVAASAPQSVETRVFFVSPAFNHVTSAQNNTFIISNINIGVNEIFDVLLVTRCQGTIGNASQVYHVGEVSITPLVAFSATVSGTPTAIGVPINIQDLRFNTQHLTLSVYQAVNVVNATHAIDGNSATWAQIRTSSLDSNLDGYGELIVTADVTSAQRANNTVSIDLVGHRRGPLSTPTVTGTFAIQTYNTATGVLLRDNLFVTQAFRQQTNPITTSYVATAINLGATTTLAVRVLARNEGGVGNSDQEYEVRDISMDTFYQPRGDSSDIFLYGDGYEGRTDPDGQVTRYLGVAAGRLLQTPDMVLASVLQQVLSLAIHEDSFATAYNFCAVNGLRFDGGIGAGWAVQQGQARDILGDLARQGTAILFPTFTASWGLRPFRSDTPVHQTFDGSTILTEYGAESQRAEDRSSTLQITLGNLKDASNHFEVRYKYNAGTKKYDGVWRVNKDGSNLPSSYTAKAELEALCLESFTRYATLEPRIEEAYWIADDTTALYYLQHLVRYFAKQRITVQFETTFKAACLQVGDFITITDRSLPAGDNGNIFEVHTIRYMPMKGRIQLVTSRVSQVPDVVIPDPPAAAVGCARLPRAGMLACWDFEEASGTRTDHIYGSTLSAVNNPLGVPGKVGNAIQFRRAQQQYLVNNDLLVGALTGAFTMAFWVRLLSIPTVPWVVVGNTADASTGLYEFFVEIRQGTGKVGTVWGEGGSGGVLESTMALPYTGSPADWTLVRIWRTFDAAFTGTFFLQLNNNAVESGTYGPALPKAYQGFAVGAAYAGGGVVSGYCDLQLDQLTIWNRVLSQPELDAIWNGGAG